jgi:polysaccharide biosynthesis transport protein
VNDELSQGATPRAEPVRAAARPTDGMLWQSIRKYYPTAFATAVTVILIAVFYTLGQTKIYEAEATVMFDPTPPRPLGRRVEAVVDMGAGDYWNNQEYYETQYQIIRSRRVALAVVRDLGLQNDQAFLQNKPEGVEPDKLPPVAPEIAADALRSRIKVEPIRDSRMATVRLVDADPRRAQRILGALCDSYVSQNLENALESTSSATAWLQKQLDTLKDDLEASELDLHQYKKKNDILSIAFDDKSSMLVDQVKQLNSELTRVKAQQQHANARRSVVAASPTDDPTAVQAVELLQSPLLNGLRAEHATAVRDYQAFLGEKKGENHPSVAAAARRVKAAEEAILKEIKNIQKAVDRDAGAAAREVGGLTSMLEDVKQQAHALNLLEIEYNRLARTKLNTEKLYDMLLERTKEADLAQMMRVNNISVVDAPVLPRAPVHPRVPLNLAVGLMAGILLGIGSALLRGLLDRTVKVPDDVEVELGLSCLGLLPEFSAGAQRSAYYGRKRRRGKRVDETPAISELVVHESPSSSIAEASRAIRTNLMFMAPDKPFQTLLVTSAGPAEGKTTVVCCIAVAMAQAGQTVAIIDCDLRRPRMHRIFRASPESGVTTALLDGKYDDVIVETDVPGVSVIPAGPVPPNPAELFHTERFAKFLAHIRGRFDRVIIDSPPIAAVTDPAVLSTLVDGTVVVVRAFRTRKELARHAARLLQAVGGTIAGVVLNAVDFTKTEYKYSYYYYRREDYYRQDGGAAPGSASQDGKGGGHGSVATPPS